MYTIKKYIINLCLFSLTALFLVQFILGSNIMAALNSSPEETTTGKKVLYLTFDDGPTIITNDLLDVLKQCNVKATFFVVGKEICGREDLLKRIYKEGHSIGLHTFSHNFKKIYKSDDIFVKEMLDDQKKVKEITGLNTNLIRFPGGSSKHLDSEMLEKLHKNNLKVYDWNASIEDGVNPHLSVDKLVNNSKKYKHRNDQIILLMHCNSNNTNTIKALPQIVNYYRSNGYAIKPITDKTPEYHYSFRK
ncbi:polysaccharide deacetylase family protein [Clostridium sp.]|jgi:peptidoglycan/xylan/chitin deacetylase (PgdA/CDA1 family)|uniref:polysaccharide deacetylase family protein n=2 Tax=Clostridium TaxID=1485 RepID=UPI00258A984A|nr:polysaccharide deacetylase family protein [Clostridium sp.]MDF2505122.1 putative xylanase/chitin deacetylase [Clostridium sp.]